MKFNTFNLCQIYSKFVYLDATSVFIIALCDNQEQQQKSGNDMSEATQLIIYLAF